MYRSYNLHVDSTYIKYSIHNIINSLSIHWTNIWVSLSPTVWWACENVYYGVFIMELTTQLIPNPFRKDLMTIISYSSPFLFQPPKPSPIVVIYWTIPPFTIHLISMFCTCSSWTHPAQRKSEFTINKERLTSRGRKDAWAPLYNTIQRCENLPLNPEIWAL